MILGIGCDIVRTARFHEIARRSPARLKRLCERILHAEERQGLPEWALARPGAVDGSRFAGPLAASAGAADLAGVVQRLAGAWAAKEALFKSLGADEQPSCRFNRWRRHWTGHRLELVSDSPRSDEVLLTLSHDGEYTMAMVVRQARADVAGQGSIKEWQGR